MVQSSNSTVSVGQSPYNQQTQTYNWNFTNPQSTAVTPGAANQANSTVGNVVNAVDVGKNLYDGYNFLNQNFGNVGSSGVGTATSATSYLPDGFHNSLQLGQSNGNIMGSNVSSGSSSSGILDSLGLGQYSNSLGGQAFGESGFLGNIGSKSGNMIGNGIMNAGAGFLGNIAGGAVFGNSTGSQVGSTIGGLAGSAFGPVGSFVGSFIGSGIGSLFGGGKKPNPAGNIYDVGFSTSGKLTGAGRFEGKHIGASSLDPLKNSFQQYVNTKSKAYNISNYNPNLLFDFGYDVNGSGFGGDSTNNSYIRARTSDGTPGLDYISFNPNDKESTDAAYKRAFDFALSKSGYDPSALTERPKATPITINRNEGPSDWDKFIAKYRSEHTTPTTQVT